MNNSPLLGHNPQRPIDIVLINSPLKNYDYVQRFNDFTLPVLGLGYIATYAKKRGFNVAVLDTEANGLGISKIAAIVNDASPRWVGLNLLAPTYRYSVEILQNIHPDIHVMLGGHQAKAMPEEILNDIRIPRIDAMILGEGEYRVAAILEDKTRRSELPSIWWREGKSTVQSVPLMTLEQMNHWLAPDINILPFVGREFFVQDPFRAADGRWEVNLVGSRGCPYDCSFCGAAKSANPDVSIRMRSPENIVSEMFFLADEYGATAFRFVDDLFLASPPFMKECLKLFKDQKIGDRFVWDATGRINVLSRSSDDMLDLMREAGCREVALGIESGNERLLSYMEKRITVDMIKKAVAALTKRGINVKGYFILGFPTETYSELLDTVRLIEELWEISDRNPGNFRCSAFEFRPYPGTPEWKRLIESGKYTPSQLLLYEHIDLTGNGAIAELLERDEFNFSVNIQFGDVPVDTVRHHLSKIMISQKKRLPATDHVQRFSFD